MSAAAPIVPPDPPDEATEAKTKLKAMGWKALAAVLGFIPKVLWFLLMLLLWLAAHAVYFAGAGVAYTFLLVAGYQAADEFFAMPIYKAVPALWHWKYNVETKDLTMAHFFACVMVVVATFAWENILNFVDDAKPAGIGRMIWKTACIGTVVVEPIIFFVGMWFGGKTVFTSLLLTAFVSFMVVICAHLLSPITHALRSSILNRKEELS